MLFNRKNKSKTSGNQTAEAIANGYVQDVLDLEKKFKEQFGYMPIRLDSPFIPAYSMEEIDSFRMYFSNRVISKRYALAELWLNAAAQLRQG